MTDPLRAPSPFLALPPTAHVARNALAFALRDKYPVAPGHTLVVPFRHIATWFDATRDEQLALLELVDDVKRALDAGVAQPDGTLRTPDGYNVGWNAGEAAGQTVMHLHVHVIPRCESRGRAVITTTQVSQSSTSKPGTRLNSAVL